MKVRKLENFKISELSELMKRPKSYVGESLRKLILMMMKVRNVTKMKKLKISKLPELNKSQKSHIDESPKLENFRIIRITEKSEIIYW